VSLEYIEEHGWQYLTLQREGRVLTVKFDAGDRINGLHKTPGRPRVASSIFRG